MCLTSHPSRTPPFSSDEETSEEEEESEEEAPQTQKKAPLVNRTTVKAQTPKTHLTPRTPAPADRTAVTALNESDSEWTDGSEMDEINVSQLHKHTDQNGNVKTSYSKEVELLHLPKSMIYFKVNQKYSVFCR